MAWAIAAGAIIGGGLSYMGSKAQASAARGASGDSAAVQRYMFDRSVELQEPWRLAGQSALGGLLGMTGLGGQMSSNWEDEIASLDEQIAELEGQRVDRIEGVASELTPEQQEAYQNYLREKQFYDQTNGMQGNQALLQAEQRARQAGVPIEQLGREGEVVGGLQADQAAQLNRLRDRRSSLQDRLDTFSTMGGGEGGFSLETTPGYQFRMDQGLQALDRSGAASGNRLSGRAIKAATRFGQGLASDEFTNQYNRLANIAGLGQTAAQTSSQAAMSAGRGIGNTLMQGGLAQANAIGQGYQNVNNSLQSGLQNYMTYQAMQNYNAG